MSETPTFALKAFLIRQFIIAGWNRRRRDNGRLEHLHGWRLVLHRILWGFDRLVYVDGPDAWIPIGEWTGEFA